MARWFQDRLRRRAEWIVFSRLMAWHVQFFQSVGFQRQLAAAIPDLGKEQIVISYFRKLLVPLDFTEKNTQALKIARKLAHENHARVTLLHVIETIDYVAEEEIEKFYDMLKDRAKVKLEQLSVPFQDAEIDVDHKIVLGKRGRGIVTFSMQHEIDLIVMSSHKVDLNAAPKGWGSLSHKVSILCPCAVLLVK